MYYFASDTHLGYGDPQESLRRERDFVKWLDGVSQDAEAIFLVGDIFDFWYEYKRVVPKGFTRVLGKLSELTDRGIAIYFFTGNHDMWQRDYFAKECGMTVHLGGETFDLCGKRVLVAHGDEIYAARLRGAGFINAIFRCRAARWLFSTFVHPDVALRWGQGWSSRSRKSKAIAAEFRGEEDFMVQYARKVLSSQDVDYFVFGHNHCAENYDLGGGHRALFLGEWINGTPVYASLDSEGNIKLNKVER